MSVCDVCLIHEYERYLYEWLDVLEDIVNVVDGEAEGLRNLELG